MKDKLVNGELVIRHGVYQLGYSKALADVEKIIDDLDIKCYHTGLTLMKLKAKLKELNSPQTKPINDGSHSFNRCVDKTADARKGKEKK